MNNTIKTNLQRFEQMISQKNYIKCENISKWICKQVELSKQSAYNNIKKNNDKINHYHPIRPLRGAIYVVDYGCNVGFEFNDLHLGLVIQNNIGNIYRDTTIVLPITELKSDEKFDKNVNIKLTNEDLIEKTKNGLDKDPSKIKVESIISIDKARLGVAVGRVTPEKIKEIDDLLKKLINN